MEGMSLLVALKESRRSTSEACQATRTWLGLQTIQYY